MANGEINEYSSGSSIRAEQTPPKKSIVKKQMVDFRGLPLSTEEGNTLVTEKETYKKAEYTYKNSPSVVLDSSSFKDDGVSTQNKFSKKFPAAVPIEERFKETSEVSRSLLGINRETTQQGIFGNVSTYGLDEKDWRVDGTPERSPEFWYNRPSSTGRYFNSRFEEDTTNSALAISTSPSPYTPPGKPSLQDQLLNPFGAERYRGWGQYLNSIIAQYLIEYMVENFDEEGLQKFNLNYLLSKYPPTILPDGTRRFNRLLWDKIWLDIRQTRFGAETDYPIIPTGRAFNFLNTEDVLLEIPLREASLWGQDRNQNVIINESNAALPININCAWDSFFFGTTRVYYPYQSSDDKGHYRIQTNPTPELWRKYFGLEWDYLREDLRNWEFTIHTSTSTVTQLERDFKLPYFVLSNPLEPNPDNIFSNSWPSQFFGTSINLPTTENKIGGDVGPGTSMSITSLRAFRYQPGRISGFTYGSKASEIGAGPGTTIEWGIENDTDAYFFRLSDGADFQVVRRSIIPLEETEFLSDSGYFDTTRTVVRNGYLQYETVVEQKNMNGDPLNGEGESGYILDPDTVTMYKVEFGWYGAIGARFYAYIPEENGDCRWVSLHTFVIENQLGKPCLGDPFFYFKYRLTVSDPSTIRLDQFLYKFGASYYIDGYDQGTVYSSFAKSKVRQLKDPKFAQTKTRLYATDWTTLMGIKPKQYLYNRFGAEIYNKKEIFPKSFSVYSQSPCEIKIIRQKGCPEYAYTHQEGYKWDFLPEKRRIKGLFFIRNFNTDNSGLGIDSNNALTHTATMAFNSTVAGDWRSPISDASYTTYLDSNANTGDLRLVGDDLFQLAVTSNAGRLFNSTNKDFKLQRLENLGRGYLSASQPSASRENVYLPFTYAPVGDYVNGYEVEFDYYRRDQILLSTVNITSNEFFIFWTGGASGGLSPHHRSSIRIGFAWPDTDDNSSLIWQDRGNDWGIETPANPGEWIDYDGQKFYEGLPIDLIKEYPNNSIYIESGTTLGVNTYNLEANERAFMGDRWDLEDIDFSPPGAEGGECRGLGCRNGIELKESTIVEVEEEDGEGGTVKVYYLQALTAWPNPAGESYDVTISKTGEKITTRVSDPISIFIGDTQFFRVKLVSGLPTGFSIGDEVDVTYSIIYIAEIDKKSRVRNVLVSRIGGGDIPFCRVFIQARQGQSIGGVWIGQKTANGIVLDPFTPHACTLNIKDSGDERSGEKPGVNDGAIKNISTTIAYDPLGQGTAPTILDGDGYIQETAKSIHSSPQKCGSFLSDGGTSSAGILSPSDYPIRWLTSNSTGLPLGTFYVPENQSVEISLEDIFNINAESIVNSDDANLATFFIARSLNNHDVSGSTKEIYMSLNYDEQ